MRASLIISTYNEGALLARTIETCLETSTGLDREILIADDASTDGSVEAVLRRFTPVRSVRHERRHGVSPTKMLGAENARGEVLIFLDGHCKPEPGSIARLVERVESQAGTAIITPTIVALDPEQWRNDPTQAGHGYTVDLYTLECGWQALDEMRPAGDEAPGLYESPAFIGCAVALSRTLLEGLWGFDRHMRSWGVEDIDLALKCWLMGRRVLHDPEAVIGHRFRTEFTSYTVRADDVVFNELRLARKAFTDGVWNQWVAARQQRELPALSGAPEGLWARAWHLLEEARDNVESERSYLLGHRPRDEFWYAERFGLDWPRLPEPGVSARAFLLASPIPSISPSISPSKPPAPTVEIQVNNTAAANDDVVRLHCLHPPSRPVVNCRIRLASNVTSPVTVVLRDPTGRLLFPLAAITTVTLPPSKAFVAFQISGEVASAALGDAIIEARVGNASGPVAGTRQVTVVSFGASKINLVQGGNYGFVGDAYTVVGFPAVHAVDFSSQATVRPPGVDCSVPQLANMRVGIMQETSAETVIMTWDTPTIAWLPAAPSGTIVTVPTTFGVTGVLDPAVPQPVNDGLLGALPLYDKTPAALTRPLGCPSGAVAKSNDTPAVQNTATFSQPASSGGAVVGTVTWTRRLSITRKQHFRTFCVIFNTSTNVFCALRQATWDLDLNASIAGQHATVNADAPASANPAPGPPQANGAQKLSPAGVGAATTTFPPKP
jgi:glycosyltransferase involved in cell wall biosynthesis